MHHVREQGTWFPKEGEAKDLRVGTDTDWAGDRISRKSVTCCVFRAGGCTLATQCIGQSIQAQSSGESEFYGNVSGVSSGLLLQHVLGFLGLSLRLVLETDSAAARGVLNRVGVGRIRHLEVKTLWVQSLVDAKRLVVRASSGKVNPADIATKILGRERMQYLLGVLNVKTVDASGSVVDVGDGVNKESGNTNYNVEQIVAAVVARLGKRQQ